MFIYFSSAVALTFGVGGTLIKNIDLLTSRGEPAVVIHALC